MEPLRSCCELGAEPRLKVADAENLAAALKAVADPVRLQLISLVTAAGEVCACDLPGAVQRSQPTVSHHLKILVEAGLLHREQRGKWAWFSLDRDRLSELSAALAPDGVESSSGSPANGVRP